MSVARTQNVRRPHEHFEPEAELDPQAQRRLRGQMEQIDYTVYASNRGHNSIVVYARDVKTGALTFVQHAPCGGKTPRHFKIDPTGKWLLCAHQDSNTISVLKLDPETGKLGEPENTVASPSPICLLFTN